MPAGCPGPGRASGPGTPGRSEAGRLRRARLPRPRSTSSPRASSLRLAGKRSAGWRISTPRGIDQKSAWDGTLDQTLIHHRVCDLDEAADVGAVEQIPGSAVLLGGLEAGAVDGPHDLVEPVVHLFAGPCEPHAVLRHLQ